MPKKDKRNEIKVSIIVPVYNVRNYLKRCVESLLAQTLDEIQIILIDDCSTDKSVDLVREYASRYQKINAIFLPKNRYLGGARNAGLQAAEGEYVTFVDSDDWVEPSMCKDLYEEAVTKNSDMVYGQYRLVNEEDQILGIRCNCFLEQLKTSNQELLKSMMILNPHYACGRLIRKSLFTQHNLYFPEHIFFEDIAIMPIATLYARKIISIEKPYYNYFQRQESITHAYTPQKAKDEINCSRLFLKGCKNRGFFSKWKDAILLKYFISACYYPMDHIQNLSLEEQKEPKKEILSIMEEVIPALKDNPYLELYTDNRTYQQVTQDTSYGIKNMTEKEFADYLKTFRKPIVWGAGKKGTDFIRKYSKVVGSSLAYVTDRKESLWGRTTETGQKIVNFYHHVEEIDAVIVVNKNHYYDISKELKEHSINKRIINYEIELLTMKN